MTIDTWPSAISCGLVDFDLVGGGRSAGSSAGLPAAIDASSGGPHWRATVSSLALLTPVHIAAARALEGRLDGGATPVMINVCIGDLSPALANSPAMGAALASSAVAGATSLHLALTGSYHPLQGGEMLNVDDADVGKRLHVITEVTGGTTSAPIVTIAPPLRADLANGAPVYFTNLSCAMHLADGFDLAVSLGRFSAIEATFEEWFEPAVVLALRTLTLSPHSIESASAEDTFVGYLLGTTAGSTITITDTAGGKFKLVDNGGGIWSIVAGATPTSYGSAHSHNITVRETLAGYLNTPHDSTLTVNVTEPAITSLTVSLINPGFDIEVSGDYLTGWTHNAEAAAITSAAGVLPQAGTRFFSPGAVGSGYNYQDLDFSALVDRIDTGHVTLTGSFGCWQAETTGQGDTSYVFLSFLDEDGFVLATHAKDPSDHLHDWVHLLLSGLTAPVGTRGVRVGAIHSRVVGPSLQAYVDSFASSVTLTYNP